jgi:hypothetical protein
MEAGDSIGIVFHRATTKYVVGDAATKAATKIRRIIANKGLVGNKSGVLVV